MSRHGRQNGVLSIREEVNQGAVRSLLYPNRNPFSAAPPNARLTVDSTAAELAMAGSAKPAPAWPSNRAVESAANDCGALWEKKLRET